MDENGKLRDVSGLVNAVQATAGGKKPYVKPSFVHERAFETMALSCGKINSSQAQCKSNKKNS
jgi:hypothetical protein